MENIYSVSTSYNIYITMQLELYESHVAWHVVNCITIVYHRFYTYSIYDYILSVKHMNLILYM